MSTLWNHWQGCCAVADATRFNALRAQADQLEAEAAACSDPDERHALLQEAIVSRAAAIQILQGEAA